MRQSQPSEMARRARRKTIEPFDAVFQGHYDLTEFIAKYRLTPLEAREIFERLGPARGALDAYMRGYGKVDKKSEDNR